MGPWSMRNWLMEIQWKSWVDMARMNKISNLSLAQECADEPIMREVSKGWFHESGLKLAKNVCKSCMYVKHYVKKISFFTKFVHKINVQSCVQELYKISCAKEILQKCLKVSCAKAMCKKCEKYFESPDNLQPDSSGHAHPFISAS